MMKLIAIGMTMLFASCNLNTVPAVSKSELPDNYALKSSCYALSQSVTHPIRVEADDTSDIRLCAVLQRDGHLGLDLRYQPEKRNWPFPIFAVVTLSSENGRRTSDMFRMENNPFSGSYELYLTDGCLIGSFGGCSQGAQKKMRDLFETVASRESLGGFEVGLAFVAMKSPNETQWDLLDPVKKRDYKFEIKSL